MCFSLLSFSTYFFISNLLRVLISRSLLLSYQKQSRSISQLFEQQFVPADKRTHAHTGQRLIASVQLIKWSVNDNHHILWVRVELIHIGCVSFLTSVGRNKKKKHSLKFYPSRFTEQQRSHWWSIVSLHDITLVDYRCVLWELVSLWTPAKKLNIIFFCF